MKLVCLKCENCDATSEINVEDNVTIVFCSHCGTKKLLDDGTKKIEHHIKNEDVARITESDNQVKLKEIELAHKEAKLKADQEKFETRIGLVVIIAVAGLIIAGVVAAISSCG
ncbi:MAG: hypothetical protein FWF77_02290 [Defluviitaleaceae bacterium]|nr:hypothetical protein [Defluviitaleaceae bacterium]